MGRIDLATNVVDGRLFRLHMPFGLCRSLPSYMLRLASRSVFLGVFLVILHERIVTGLGKMGILLGCGQRRFLGNAAAGFGKIYGGVGKIGRLRWLNIVQI